MLIELLVHLLTVLSWPSVDFHHGSRLSSCDFLRIEDSLRLSFPQIGRRPFRCTHLVQVDEVVT